MSDRELWSAVFIAAIGSGKACGTARDDADMAVAARLNRFPPDKHCPACDEPLP